jgi:hypothetical protein
VRDWRCAVALLHALGERGPVRALTDVDRHASGFADPGPETYVREAARQAAAKLRERTALEREHSRLLRPAAPPVSSNELLRPAELGASGETRTLLRPVDDAPASEGEAAGDQPHRVLCHNAQRR